MENYDDIRPYRDEEIPAAMRRITESEAFPLLASWIFPDRGLEEVRRELLSYHTIKEFQYGVMMAATLQIIRRSIDQLSYSGFEQLRPDTQYLFVSNHRDIVLDALLLQKWLVKHERETTEITFGANLMQQIEQNVQGGAWRTHARFLYVVVPSEQLHPPYHA